MHNFNHDASMKSLRTQKLPLCRPNPDARVITTCARSQISWQTFCSKNKRRRYFMEPEEKVKKQTVCVCQA